MKLSLISEIQLKYPDTNMNRTSTTQVYGVGSINDLYHHHYKTRRWKKLKNQNLPIRPNRTTNNTRIT